MASVRSAAAEIQQKLFLTKAYRRNAVVEVLETLPIHLLDVVFSCRPRDAGNVAQLLGALTPELQAIAVKCCCRSDVLEICCPTMTSFNKRPGTALGASLVHLSSLTVLDLQGHASLNEPYSAEGTTPVTGCRLGLVGLATHLSCLTNLARFTLTNMHIDGIAAKALSSGLLVVRTLRQLQLISCTLPEDYHPNGIALICERSVGYLNTLTDCHFNNNNLRDLGTELLCAALQQLTSLVTLNLPDNAIGVRGTAALAAALVHLAHLQILNLENNNIGEGNLAEFGRSIGQLGTLKGLGLNNNRISSSHIASLTASITCMTSLRWLRMSNATLGLAGASSLATHMTAVNWLEHIELKCCQIGTAGAEHLGPLFMGMPRLEWVELSENSIGDAGCVALAPALSHCKNMVELKLGYNEIGDAGAAALAVPVGSMCRLEELDLDGNLISSTGALEIARMLPGACVVSVLGTVLSRANALPAEKHSQYGVQQSAAYRIENASPNAIQVCAEASRPCSKAA
jgi:Leucine-rich repeat (LRR) protein